MFFITKLYIKNYRQFDNLVIDLTYQSGPKKGFPLEKICFIGKNGTGKSTILSIIESFLNTPEPTIGYGPYFVKARYNDINLFMVYDFNGGRPKPLYFKEEIEQFSNFENLLFSRAVPSNTIDFAASQNLLAYLLDGNLGTELNNLHNRNGKNDRLLIKVPSDTNQTVYMQLGDVPNTNVSQALALFDVFPYRHIVSPDTISEFWRTLIFLIKKRESDLNEFRNLNENLDRTVRAVNQDFEKNNPRILDKISELWSVILDKGGLLFDIKQASNPVQLNDNLKAYIKPKNRSENISYYALSTGIREFIFRLGHVYSLYFGRPIKQGYLILDEPENSLFPDILYDLVELYIAATKNTQLLVSTHSPIIAAQFEANERIILDFSEDGKVIHKRGITPVGDDPNDILLKDFGVRSLLGKEGIKKWERYIELKLLIRNTEDKGIKSLLIKELMAIGNAYNFDKTAVE